MLICIYFPWGPRGGINNRNISREHSLSLNCFTISRFLVGNLMGGWKLYISCCLLVHSAVLNKVHHRKGTYRKFPWWCSGRWPALPYVDLNNEPCRPSERPVSNLELHDCLPLQLVPVPVFRLGEPADSRELVAQQLTQMEQLQVSRLQQAIFTFWGILFITIFNSCTQFCESGSGRFRIFFPTSGFGTICFGSGSSKN